MNQQLTTVTEEIEELKSRKEQLIFQAECSTDKDMTNLSKKYDQMNKNLDVLDSQDVTLKAQLKATFGKYYDYHRRDIAAEEVDYLNVEDPDVFSHRAWELEYQKKQETRRNQPVRSKKKSHDMEL